MYMKLIEPNKVRVLMARKSWFSAEDMAKSIPLHANTIRKALRGENIDGDTALKIAVAVDADVLEIASFVDAKS